RKRAKLDLVAPSDRSSLCSRLVIGGTRRFGECSISRHAAPFGDRVSDSFLRNADHGDARAFRESGTRLVPLHYPGCSITRIGPPADSAWPCPIAGHLRHGNPHRVPVCVRGRTHTGSAAAAAYFSFVEAQRTGLTFKFLVGI